MTHLVVEGTHGVGKTTAITELQTRGTIQGLGVIPGFLVPWDSLMEMPGDTLRSYRINDVARSQAQLHMCGRHTIGDRSYSSTLAFAAVAHDLGMVPPEFLSETQQWVASALDRQLLLRADKITVFDLPAEVAWKRINARGASDWTSFEEVSALRDFHRQPPNWYLELVASTYEVVTSSSVNKNVAELERAFT